MATPAPSDTFYDRLVAKAEERRQARRRETYHELYGGRAADLQAEIEQLSEDEEAFYKQTERIANFGRQAFIPLGKTQRSLDESGDSDGDGALTEREGHDDSHREDEEAESPSQAIEGESSEDLVGGDLDADIEDMDNPSGGGASGATEGESGYTERSGSVEI